MIEAFWKIDSVRLFGQGYRRSKPIKTAMKNEFGRRQSYRKSRRDWITSEIVGPRNLTEANYSLDCSWLKPRYLLTNT